MTFQINDVVRVDTAEGRITDLFDDDESVMQAVVEFKDGTVGQFDALDLTKSDATQLEEEPDPLISIQMPASRWSYLQEFLWTTLERESRRKIKSEEAKGIFVPQPGSKDIALSLIHNLSSCYQRVDSQMPRPRKLGKLTLSLEARAAAADAARKNYR